MDFILYSKYLCIRQIKKCEICEKDVVLHFKISQSGLINIFFINLQNLITFKKTEKTLFYKIHGLYYKEVRVIDPKFYFNGV